MGVEFIPKNRDCFEFGLANGTWFKFLDNKKFKDILRCDKTNDPLDVSSDDVKRLLVVVDEIEITDKIYGTNRSIKEMFIDFLKCCDGFTTS